LKAILFRKLLGDAAMSGVDSQPMSADRSWRGFAGMDIRVARVRGDDSNAAPPTRECVARAAAGMDAAMAANAGVLFDQIDAAIEIVAAEMSDRQCGH